MISVWVAFAFWVVWNWWILCLYTGPGAWRCHKFHCILVVGLSVFWLPYFCLLLLWFLCSFLFVQVCYIVMWGYWFVTVGVYCCVLCLQCSTCPVLVVGIVFLVGFVGWVCGDQLWNFDDWLWRDFPLWLVMYQLSGSCGKFWGHRGCLLGISIVSFIWVIDCYLLIIHRNKVIVISRIILTVKLSRYVFRLLRIVSGRKWMKPCFLRKYPSSLMSEPSWWKHYRDSRGRDSLALDLFSARLVETQVQSEEKIASGVVHPGTFVILQESPHTRK